MVIDLIAILVKYLPKNMLTTYCEHLGADPLPDARAGH